MKKEKLIETLNELPAEFDLDDLIEKLIFKDKVEKGLKQFEEGKFKPHDQVKVIIKEW